MVKYNDKEEFLQAVLAAANTVIFVASTIKKNYDQLTPEEIQEGKQHIADLINELKTLVDESEHTDDKLRRLMDELHTVGGSIGS